MRLKGIGARPIQTTFEPSNDRYSSSHNVYYVLWRTVCRRIYNLLSVST